MKKYRILIVEDEGIVAIDLKQTLEKLGYEVTSLVSSGIKAVEKAEADHPDLILMDIRLQSKLDGIDAGRIISARHKIPIVYLSSFNNRDIMKYADSISAAGYLSKPFDENKLKLTIDNALSSGLEESINRSSN
jgi:CheY-like chemotaxis protein